jgi:hypothetical protein
MSGFHRPQAGIGLVGGLLIGGFAVFIASCLRGGLSWEKASWASGLLLRRLKNRFDHLFLTHSEGPFRGLKRRGGEDSCGGF